MRWIITVVIVMALISPVLAQAPLVRCGMRGEAVREIQELLVELGHELVVDGIFGTETESLVMHVQKALGLAADGVVGPKQARHWTNSNMLSSPPIRCSRAII